MAVEEVSASKHIAIILKLRMTPGYPCNPAAVMGV
jgi:hypothetical protein